MWKGKGLKFKPKENAMNLKNVSRKLNPAPREWATYFGLTVQITVRMKNCSLIRWRDREFIVDTEDLQLAAELAA
jgi:hypothetical protein